MLTDKEHAELKELEDKITEAKNNIKMLQKAKNNIKVKNFMRDNKKKIMCEVCQIEIFKTTNAINSHNNSESHQIKLLKLENKKE